MRIITEQESKLNLPPITERTFSIVIPKRDNSGREIKPSLLNTVVLDLMKRFGGATVIPVKGCYIENNNIKCEENYLVKMSRDFSNPYDKDPDVEEYKNKCTTPTLDNRTTDYCIHLANRIYTKDRDYVYKKAKEIGKLFGQDTVYVSEEVDKDIKMIGGKYESKLPDERIGVDNIRLIPYE